MVFFNFICSWGLIHFLISAFLIYVPGLATNAFYGTFPQGYLKLAPTSSFSIEVGKLPTLIGAEYTFSFENMNIQRGLLWNQENAVNRGAQVNYTAGPVSLSVAYSDGMYSNNYKLDFGIY